MDNKAEELLSVLHDKSPVDGLQLLAELYPGEFVFTTSFINSPFFVFQ